MIIAKGHSPAFMTGLLVTATLTVSTYFTPSLADAVFPIGGTAIRIYLLFRQEGYHNFRHQHYF
jgi:hypothetical protein